MTVFLRFSGKAILWHLSRDVGNIVKAGGGQIDWGSPWQCFWKWDWALSLRVKQCKLSRRSGDMFPQEILKLRSSEIARNVYFSIHFCILKAFKEGHQVTQRRALCLRLWKVGGICPLCPLCPSGSYVHALKLKNNLRIIRDWKAKQITNIEAQWKIRFFKRKWKRKWKENESNVKHNAKTTIGVPKSMRRLKGKGLINSRQEVVSRNSSCYLISWKRRTASAGAISKPLLNVVRHEDTEHINTCDYFKEGFQDDTLICNISVSSWKPHFIFIFAALYMIFLMAPPFVHQHS